MTSMSAFSRNRYFVVASERSVIADSAVRLSVADADRDHLGRFVGRP
jgi:hypothetical protein